jgi:hypothetical protein
MHGKAHTAHTIMIRGIHMYMEVYKSSRPREQNEVWASSQGTALNLCKLISLLFEVDGMANYHAGINDSRHKYSQHAIGLSNVTLLPIHNLKALLSKGAGLEHADHR